MGSLGLLLDQEQRRRKALAGARIVADPTLCVQCGICAYNCPVGIDIRAYTWQGQPVNDDRCITCGECVARCPRGVLSFRVLPRPL